MTAAPRSPASVMPRRLLWLGLAVLVLVVGTTDIRKRSRVETGRNDFSVYYVASRAVLDGRGAELYDVTNARGLYFNYPPFFAIFVVPVTLLGGEWAGVGFFLLSVAMLWGCGREIGRLARFVAAASDPPVPRRLAWMAGLATALPAWSCLQHGQTGILLLYLLLVATRLVAERRSPLLELAAGFLFALPVAIKLTPAMPAGTVILLLALVREPGALRRAVRVAAGFAAGCLFCFLLLPGLVIGWHENLELVAEFAQRFAIGQEDMLIEYEKNQSPAQVMPKLAESVGLPAPVGEAMATAVRLAALASVLALLAVFRRGAAGRGVALTAAFATLGTLLVSPISWQHHFVLAAPALVLVPLSCIERGEPGQARTFSWLALGTTIVYWILRDLGPTAGLLGLGYAVWFFLAVVVVWRGELSGGGGGQRSSSSTSSSSSS